MHRRVLAITAMGAAAAFAVVAPAVAGNEFKNKYGSATTTHACPATTNGNDNHIDYFGPAKLWPPNHKLQDVHVSAIDDSGTEPVTLTLTFDVDDATGGDGGPTHDPDIVYAGSPMASGQGSATVPFQLRSERSGKGDGRTYNIHADATFTGQSCHADFSVFVPHDMGGGADWKP
jgi:hypothetical protein